MERTFKNTTTKIVNLIFAHITPILVRNNKSGQDQFCIHPKVQSMLEKIGPILTSFVLSIRITFRAKHGFTVSGVIYPTLNCPSF